ncbi:pyridoxamine 5'-phosphate oxidase family protein [Deinococcus humi]|uniref:Pyridoxamine 5'-phosphate oxidase N-terminal domain-containing protein n=1 Tax=Deinococcus humi TaxID=662880 RepID=A0A7W8NG38_9DEIO|nr:pyridoxamine 5'-phosphate oxidase family protein [Deinococcus humi]MBB5365056.1 hypothetical protein [Deinococcus humi]GGO39429.1 pyridoxamine 5'-phosphate oxidase [Deinococcus humi]
MAKQFAAIDPDHQAFIEKQPVFFVGTAAAEGRVNVSPKGMDSLRVLGPNRVMWLNVTGSGNETAVHLLQLPRMTLMFCAFEGAPLILRLYGTARMVQPDQTEWPDLYAQFLPLPAARQIYLMDVDLVQTSCGMAVPLMGFQAGRETLNDVHRTLGEEQLSDYQQSKNTRSIDGFPTGLLIGKMPIAETRPS